MNSTLHEYIASAKESVLLYYRNGISVGVLNSCIQALEKGIPVELFIHADHQFQVLQEPFLFNKCLLFIKKGGCIRLDPATEINNLIVLIDYSVGGFGASENELSVFESGENSYPIQESIDRFNSKKLSPYFLRDENDIDISLRLNKTTVQRGDSIEISWTVRNADTIKLEGTGEIKTSGSINVQPEKSIPIKLGAYNKTQTAYASAYIRVTDGLTISYDLGFLSPVNQQFHSIVNAATHPDVYGVQAGHTLRLSWDIPEAESVSISPLNLTQKKGQVEFIPEQSTTLVISARANGKTITKNIQIKLFPVALFTEKILSTPELIKKFNLALHASQGPGWNNSQNIKKGTEPLQLYTRLTQQTRSIYERYAAQVNVASIQTSLFSFLKKKKKANPEVVELLNRLSEVYEHRNSDRKNADKK